MGLGIRIVAPIEGRGWLKRRPKPGAVLDTVEEACRAAIDDPMLAALARFTRDDDSALQAWLHPGTEPVEFRIDGDALIASSTTNPAGPGYHVWVVELLERIGERAKLAWDWSPDGEPGDECGYRESRSVERVQQEMLAWLRSTCRLILEQSLVDVCLCLPIELRPVRHGVCSPLGVLGAAWIERVASAEGAELAGVGAGFFSWWNPARDAAFWKGYGEVLCWQSIPWRPAISEDETALYDAALSAFGRARELAPTIALPEAEIAELRRYRVATSDAPPPSPTGIGYRRGDIRWSAPGLWTICLPGSWSLIDNGDSIQLHDDTRTVYLSALRVDGASAEKLLSSRDDVPATARWREDRHHGRAHVEFSEGLWHLYAMVAVDGRICIATVTYRDESLQPWAEAVVRTIRYTGD